MGREILVAVTSIVTDPLLARHLLFADIDTNHLLLPTHDRNVVVFCRRIRKFRSLPPWPCA